MENFEKIIVKLTDSIKNNNYLFLICFALIMTALFFVSLYVSSDDIKFIYGNF